MPILSIIIPVYNAEKTIGKTLESLDNIPQKSREQVEIVLVDDGSTDGSFKIVASKKKALSHYKVNIVRQTNGGSAAARNTALKVCGGEWVFFLDADDELAFNPVPYIKKYVTCSSLGFSVEFYKNLKPRGVLRPALVTIRNHLDVCTSVVPFSISNVIFKKEKMKSMFEPRFTYLEDWVFWTMNPLIFEDMKVFPGEISVVIHSHGSNKSSNYKKVGCYREKVANEFLELFSGRLSNKQRNNLLIQEQIGLILQGKKIKLKSFMRFPCSLKLYGKLMVYAVLRSYFPKFDIYGS